MVISGIKTLEYIKNNAWVTVNNDFLGYEWGELPKIFTSDKSRVKIIGKSLHEWPSNRYSR